jgi:hypothetical protein
MAQRAAVASGNWSNPAIWNGGILPEPGDIVASNGFTVTIDQNINVDSITNAATTVVTEVPLMTSNTAPSGIASHSGTGGFANFSAHLSFDRGSGLCYYPGPVTGDWIAYEFPTAKKIGRFGVSFNGGSNTVSYSLEAWNGSTWVVIGTHTANGAFTYSPVFVNTTAYLKYRIVLSGTNTGAQITEFYLYDALSLSAVAGGTFILNDGLTVTCTNAGDGIYNVAGTTCLNYVGTSGSSTINANIRGRDGTTVFCIRKSGTGTLNVNGTLRGLFSTNANGGALQITGTGTVNITGNIQDPSNGGQTVQVDATSNLNIVGSIYSGYYNGQQTVKINASNCVISIVGNIYVGGGGSTNWSVAAVQFNNSNTTLTLTGDIIATDGNSTTKGGLVITGANCIIQHTGNIIGSSDNVLGGTAFTTSQVIYYNQVGYIKASMAGAGFTSTNVSAINILTGPFISSPTGIQPLSVTRMHYRRTIGSYFEFRNNSTNGALPPAASAPATRLVSPDTIADSPIPANVRQGTVYSLGSQTGTMVVPSPSNVANNVPVDNTVGTAVLDPTAIWAVPLTSINTLNSIGRRVKNAATVETTGAQIQTTLNNNP